jgi:ABC-type transport system involved in cytochrome c biogenesis permease subunit
VVFVIHQLVACLYLAAGIGAAAGLGFARPRVTQVAVGTLCVGWGLHAVGFSLLHTLDPPPPLSDVGPALSFMAWVGVAGFLVLLWRARLQGLMVLVAPVAFMGTWFGLQRLEAPETATYEVTGGMPHLHVLFGSAGLALLGLAFLAGLLFLTEHHRLKAKRSLTALPALPSLEALDRVNVLALTVGFPLLTLGLVTGALWVEGVHGSPWTGSLHEVGASLGWVVYAVLVVLRFAAHQGARQCATSAVGGFAVLFAGYLGVGLLQ